MITLIHGDDTAASRSFYIEKKKLAPDPITLEADQVNLTDLVQILGSGGLFGEEKHIFIDSLLTKRKKSTELSAILSQLSSQKDANIYLWEGKEIEKRMLSTLKNVESRLFKLPQSLFLFLDALTPGNARLLPLFHQVLETVEPEMVFFMLTRQLRILLALSDSSGEVIDEVKRLAPWQQTKLQKQGKQFGVDRMKAAYHRLYEIDLGAKTGTLPNTLSAAIDFWLLEL